MSVGDLMIIQNQARCTKCGDEPYSASRHDFKHCKCGAIFVDGGLDYLRRGGEITAYEDMSISLPRDAVKAATEAAEQAKETGRNSFGVFCAVMRSLRDSGVRLEWDS